MLNFIYRNLLPVRLRNHIDIFLSLRGRFNIPEVIEKPQGSKVIVLSPHPDDEIIGCGGTLHKHHLAGDNVVAVYMTDGRKGGFISEPEDELVLKRREESRRAGKIIGINEFIFLENRDFELTANKETSSQITGLLGRIEPDIVYLPSLLDSHPDHMATNNILCSVIKKKDYRFAIYAYEVWTPLPPNCIVDISPYIDIKKKALEEFHTQTIRANIIDAAIGLAKYRSVTQLYGDKYVECFLSCEPQEYIRLWRLVS